MNRDIAIIGMAMRCPEASNTKELIENLKNKKDSVRSFSEKRIRETSIDVNRPLRAIGFLEDIDKFDYPLFHLSKSEAAAMDPHHRLLLETVYETIENSGYSTDHFDGSKSSVYLADINPEYYKLADSFEEIMIAGNSPAFAAARIARQFNLTGNALVVDTACSSSLVAVHTACNELILGETEYAFVGGANLNFLPYCDKEAETSIWSSDGKSRAFSEQANGMSCGEVVACILLKRLEDAVADNDNIHAIIKATAVNNNANRSASPSAPDSISQSNVILDAWKRASINPMDLGFIEAHGSGTKLGDSLEIEGLTIAFRQYTDQTKLCPISTIKSNIGHPYGCSGVASLIKAAIAVKKGIIFPSIHVKELNRMIDFGHSPVYVETECREWKSNNNKPRIAGVTSLGASGTNCHLVIQEPPEKIMHIKSDESENIFTISSRTYQGLEENIKKLVSFIEKDYSGENLTDIACTLNIGRHHFGKRIAVLAQNEKELKTKLQDCLTSGIKNLLCDKRNRETFFVFNDFEVTEEAIGVFSKANNIFKDAVQECRNLVENENCTHKTFIFQYALYNLLKRVGIKCENLLCEGIGKVVGNVILNKISLLEGLKLCEEYKKIPILEIDARFKRLIGKKALDQNYCFIFLSSEEELLTSLQGFKSEGYDIDLVYLEAKLGNKELLEYIKDLYEFGYSVEWNEWHNNALYNHIELPTYAFEKHRCWIRESAWVESRVVPKEIEDQIDLNNLSVIEKKMVSCWKTVLDTPITDINQSFFDCGGDSLKATLVINEMEKITGVRLDFEDVFDYPSIKELSDYIQNCISIEKKIIIIFCDILNMQDINEWDNFFDLGGHSLMANKLLIRLNEQFGINLNFEDVFNNPSARELAEFIKNNTKKSQLSEVDSIIKIPEAQYYTASEAQKQLWVMSQFAGGSAAYNSPFSIEVNGKIDGKIFDKTILTLIERHESLRTVFLQKEDEVLQKILSATELKFEFEKFSNISKEEIEKIINEDMEIPFDLVRGPLIRGKLFFIENQSIVYFNIHHIVHDGWSSKVFLNDFISIYNAFSKGKENPLESLKVQYKDYAEWQKNVLKSDEIYDIEAFWKNIFKEEISHLNLSIAKPRKEKKSYKGDKVTNIISYEKMQNIKKFCKDNRITLYMFLMGAVDTLLYLYSENTDIVVGSPIAGRNQIILENQIGYYANTLALRTKLDENMKVSELFKLVKEVTLGAFDNQDYPFDRVVSIANQKREVNRNPIFDVMMVLQNTDMVIDASLELNGAKIENISDLGISSLFDLHFEFIENPCGISAAINYDIELFEKQDILDMAENFNELIEILVSLDVKIGTIHLKKLESNFSIASWKMDELLEALNCES